METDAKRMCQLLVGLPAVTVLGVVDEVPELPIVVHVETIVDVHADCSPRGRWSRTARRCRWWTFRCSGGGPGWCGSSAAGAVRTVSCAVASWTELAPSIAGPRWG